MKIHDLRRLTDNSKSDLYAGDPPNFFRRPAGIMISGETGTGKTNLLVNCLMNCDYDRCWVFTKQVDEPLYELLGDFLENMKQETDGRVDYLISSNLDEVPSLEEIDGDLRHIFVFDDMVTSVKDPAHAIVEEIAIRGRKKNVTWFYLTQRLNSVPPIIRDNAQYIVLFRCPKSVLVEYFKKYGGPLEAKQFYSLFHRATRNRHSFFLIDTKTDERKWRFRENFDVPLLND